MIYTFIFFFVFHVFWKWQIRLAFTADIDAAYGFMA